MNPLPADRFAAARQIASQCFSLAESARGAYIDGACGEDAGLKGVVCWMLEMSEHTGEQDLLNVSPVETLSQLDANISIPAPRNYEVWNRLGSGGTGVVYRAERVEGDYRQEVALKVLSAGALFSPSSAIQFAAERKILAELHHPNIAHLIDGGTLDDGRPFLAIEYIDGRHIDAYCDAAALGTRARLQLFLKVCAAVRYAHTHLVIHRDIKPQNILVTDDGEPKLLDFGIARIMDESRDSQKTQDGQRQFTPAYASPEQIRGEPLSTATDVYSLGVLLYWLLTDRSPYGNQTDSASVAIAVLQFAPQRPSARTLDNPNGVRASVRRRLDSDLDAIVLKALEKAPQDRYGSVQELMDDIERYRIGAPVRARRQRTWYVFRKFVKRRRWPLAFGAAAMVLALVFLVDRQVQLDRTREEKQRADSTVNLLLSLFKGTEPNVAKDPNVRAMDLLDRAAVRIDAQTRGSPVLGVALRSAIARAYYRIGARDNARRIFDSIFNTPDELLLPVNDRIETLEDYGGLLFEQGERENAEARVREAWSLAKGEFGNGVEAIKAERALVAAMVQCSKPECLNEALELARDAIIRSLAAFGKTDATTLRSRQALAVVLDGLGKTEESIREMQQAIGDLVPDADNRELELDLNHELGRLYLVQRQPSKAEPYMQRAFGLAEGLYDPQSARWQPLFSNMSDLRAQQGRAKESLDFALRNHKIAPGQPMVVCNLSMALLMQSRVSEASSILQDCLRARFSSTYQSVAWERGHARFVEASVSYFSHDEAHALEAAQLAIGELKSDRRYVGLLLATYVVAVHSAIATDKLEVARHLLSEATTECRAFKDCKSTSFQLDAATATVDILQKQETASSAESLTRAWENMIAAGEGCKLGTRYISTDIETVRSIRGTTFTLPATDAACTPSNEVSVKQ